MRIRLQVEYLDGEPAVVEALAGDICRFEDHFEIAISSLGQNVRMKHLAYLAWLACKRTNPQVAEFDTWLDTVAVIQDVPAGEDTIPPLGSSQPTGSSAD